MAAQMSGGESNANLLNTPPHNFFSQGGHGDLYKGPMTGAGGAIMKRYHQMWSTAKGSNSHGRLLNRVPADVVGRSTPDAGPPGGNAI